MDSEYPPLPSSKSIGASLQNVSLSDSDGVAQGSSRSGSGTPVSVPVTNGRGQISKSPRPNTNTQVIVDGGDLILEYTPSKQTPLGTANAPVTYRWKVFSESLIQSSPYFRVFLDPEKFSEGRNFMKQRELHSFDVDPGLNGDADATGFPEQDDALPIMRMPENHLSHRLGPDTIGFFLRVLSFNSFNEEEKENFNAEVKSQRPLFIAGVIEMADAFNSPQAVRDALKRSGYTLGKPKLPLTKFNSSMLKLNEDRVRQSAFIARFLNDRTVFQMLTHALIVSGSRFWVNGLEAPEPGALSWHYFANGIEEELYYRRQCVLDTITDLQAHFLRVYGALEDPSGPKRSNPSATSTPTPTAASRQYQCRCALGNSSACDTFHLGQMTRFFSLRTKTIFIGSTLLDPDFKPDIEDADADGDTYAYEDAETGNQPERPPDITSVISLLKQCPDYQIDSNHTACGIRRRFLPSLDCIEGFVGDERGLLGVNLNYWRGEENRSVGERKWPNVLGSWANRSHRRAYVMDLRLSRISGIPSMSPGSVAGQFREEDARLLFTAKKRNWES